MPASLPLAMIGSLAAPLPRTAPLPLAMIGSLAAPAAVRTAG